MEKLLRLFLTLVCLVGLLPHMRPLGTSGLTSPAVISSPTLRKPTSQACHSELPLPTTALPQELPPTMRVLTLC